MVKLGCAEEMAEELAQQTLLQVWRKAQLYVEEGIQHGYSICSKHAH